jgi:hypothetical protein
MECSVPEIRLASHRRFTVMPVKTGIQNGRMPYAHTKIAGFRVAPAIASLPGMTIELCSKL